MAYTITSDFKSGLDRRRPLSALGPGVLYDLINAHITRGGDIEKRKAFALDTALPANTFGLRADPQTSQLRVFGSDAPGLVFLSAPYVYQQLAHPTAQAMTAILDTDIFDGKIYAIAQYADASIHHFYNGARITDWDGGAGNPAAKGRTALTYGSKIYSTAGSTLYYSGANLPAGWTIPTDVGAGFINMGNQDAGSSVLTGTGVYQQYMAIFAQRAVQIWNINADDTKNSRVQVIKNTGTVARKSIISFGEVDLFYLDYTGIRSLRARDASNSAAISDVGTLIDSYVLQHMATLTPTQIAAAIGVIDPTDGRYWLALGDKIFVLSFFPGARITAWSEYQPGFTITDITDLNGRLYLRAADGNSYLYGGPLNQTYDSSPVTVQMPYLTASRPASYKNLVGFDMDCTNSWDVDILVDPRSTARKIKAGRIVGITYNVGTIGLLGHCTHFAPKLVCNQPGYASVSSVAVHFEGAEQEA